jgi:hypothetical protein
MSYHATKYEVLIWMCASDLRVSREPLCKLLDKDVPEEAFPHGNVAADFMPRAMAVDGDRMAHARANALKLAIVLSAITMAAAGLYWR